MKQDVKLYKRSFDSGHGVHWLEVDAATGIVRRDWLAPRPGANHRYDGRYRESLVGRSLRSLRGRGFRRVRMSDMQYLNYLASTYVA